MSAKALTQAQELAAQVAGCQGVTLVIEITNKKGVGLLATMRHVKNGQCSPDKVLAPVANNGNDKVAQLTALRNALAATQGNLRQHKALELALPVYAQGIFRDGNKVRANKELVTEIYTLLNSFKSVLVY